MKVLLLCLIVILFVKNNCESYQKGAWSKQVYKNTSFLFNYLGVESGYAFVHMERFFPILRVTLRDSQKSQKCIKLMILMQTVKYMTDSTLNLDSKKIDFTFEDQNSNTYGQQQIDLRKKHTFNISYVNRKSLEIRSKEGTFTIKLIDLNQIQPHIQAKMWLVLIIIVFVFLFSMASVDNRKQQTYFDNYLGVHTLQLLWMFAYRYTWCLWDQSYYIRDGWNVFILVCAIVLIIMVETALFCLVMYKQKSKFQGNFSGKVNLIVFACAIAYFFHMWYLLLPLMVYQLFKIVKIGESQKACLDKGTFLGIYLLPICFFPLFSIEVNYPQNESEFWWVYLTFCLFQMAIFQFRLFGRLKEICKRLTFMIRRLFRRKDQLAQQSKQCSICSKQMEVNQLEMGTNEEIQKNTWIKAPCNHYFHKQCLKDSIKLIQNCPIDASGWTPQFAQQICA